MRSTKNIYAAILLILLIPINVHAGWKFVTPMPKRRYGHDATLGPDGKIYVMGGMVVNIFGKKMGARNDDDLYSILVYGRQEDRWEFLEPVPGFRLCIYIQGGGRVLGAANQVDGKR
jgi:hypothetical protein